MKIKAYDIREENKKRNSRLRKEENLYNPIIGSGSPIERTLIEIRGLPVSKFYAPKEMLSHPLIIALISYGSVEKYLIEGLNVPARADLINAVIEQVEKIRIRTDFEYTAVTYFRIKPKAKEGITNTGDVPFILNRGQRKLLKKLEELRCAGKPIRIILCKARQWGGSTLIQIYMAWLQLFHFTQWNSTICAHVESTARIIKGMYVKLLKYIPPQLLDSKTPLELKPYMGSQKTSIIKQRDCRITIGSAEKQDGVRGEDTTMAHLSEIGLYKKTPGKSPEDLINSVCSGIHYISNTMIVYESTAKGVGNFFHREWQRAVDGKSTFSPVFVAWFETGTYSLPIENIIDFINNMTEYDLFLWEQGATLEQINWYKHEAAGKSEDWMMKQEFPSNDVEAFQSSGRRKFDQYQVASMRKSCFDPIYWGDVFGESTSGEEALKNVRFIQQEKPKVDDNLLKVWAMPSKELIRNRYVVSVDIGGKSSNADWSVIKVFDRKYMMELGGVPEVVASWRGHIDHDLLAWKAAQIAKFYNNALLVVESNTLETEGTEGQHFEYILDEIAEWYDNLYCRNNADRIKHGLPAKWGFHMNTSSKTLVMDHMVKMLRTSGYLERDLECCNEMDTYEIKENGSLGAVEGCHDDIIMTTATGVFVCYDTNYIPLPEYYEEKTSTGKPKKQIYSEANF